MADVLQERRVELVKQPGVLAFSGIMRLRSVQLLLVGAVMAAVGCARVAVSPLQEVMRIGLSLTDNQIALLQGPAMTLPIVVAAIPLGLLVDRYSRVRLLLVFLGLTVLGSISTALAGGLAVLFAARCLVGAMAHASAVTALSLLSDLFAPEQRGRATMTASIGEVAGTSAAFGLGGTLLVILAPDPSSWRWTMCWLTAPLLLAMLLLLGMGEPQRTEAHIDKPTLRKAWRALWRYRAVLMPLLIGKVMVGIAYGAILTWAAPALARGFALAPDRIGAIMATVLMISGVTGPLAGGLLADFCHRSGGPRRTMLALSCMALFSVPAGIFAVVQPPPLAFVLLVVFMAVVPVLAVTLMALATVVIPRELRGLSLSLMIAMGLAFGLGLAPVIVSMLSNALGGPAMLGKALAATCVATGVVGALVFVIGRRYLPQQIDEACSDGASLVSSRDHGAPATVPNTKADVTVSALHNAGRADGRS